PSDAPSGATQPDPAPPVTARSRASNLTDRRPVPRRARGGRLCQTAVVASMGRADMSHKPSYLGLLNAVSLAETAAHEYLTAWAAVTPHDGVKATLLTVAAREGEHGMSFAKRINEPGYNLRPGPDDPKRAERTSIACSTEISDYDKIHALGVARIAEEVANTGPDIFDKFFSDHSIDIQTGALLGRYIAAHRASGRR